MNYRYILLAVAIMLSIIVFSVLQQPKPVEVEPIGLTKISSLVKIYSCLSTEDSPLAIRVLILRHANEQMAINDANLAKRGIEKARQKGLNIQVVGDEYVGSISQLKSVLNASIKKNSTYNDTLIIHTIGHGSESGWLQSLGQRKDVFQTFVEAAEASKQEMLWWQLSCHAAANLPNMDTLTEEQKELFANLASSTASELSWSGVQGVIMEKIFIAMADKSIEIDPNQDDTITAQELADFLNKDGSKRGNLLFANNPNEPIFGSFGPNSIPIRDRDDPNSEFDRRYIPKPIRVFLST